MSVLPRTLAISDLTLHSLVGKPRPTPEKGLGQAQPACDGWLPGGKGLCGVLRISNGVWAALSRTVPPLVYILLTQPSVIS